MVSALSHSSFPFPDSGKQGEDAPAGDFSTDFSELRPHQPGMLGRRGGAFFSVRTQLPGLMCSVSVLPWPVGEQGLVAW